MCLKTTTQNVMRILSLVIIKHKVYCMYFMMEPVGRGGMRVHSSCYRVDTKVGIAWP